MCEWVVSRTDDFLCTVIIQTKAANAFVLLMERLWPYYRLGILVEIWFRWLWSNGFSRSFSLKRNFPCKIFKIVFAAATNHYASNLQTGPKIQSVFGE